MKSIDKYSRQRVEMIDNSIIVEFVKIQEGLLNSLFREHPVFLNNPVLLNAPHQLELSIQDEKWIAKKHGAGVEFVRKIPFPQIVVDAHNFIEKKNFIDAHRLHQFLESLGYEITFEQAENFLQQKNEMGALKKSMSSGYEIVFK